MSSPNTPQWLRGTTPHLLGVGTKRMTELGSAGRYRPVEKSGLAELGDLCALYAALPLLNIRLT